MTSPGLPGECYVIRHWARVLEHRAPLVGLEFAERTRSTTRIHQTEGCNQDQHDCARTTVNLQNFTHSVSSLVCLRDNIIRL